MHLCNLHRHAARPGLLPHVRQTDAFLYNCNKADGLLHIQVTLLDFDEEHARSYNELVRQDPCIPLFPSACS